MFDNRLNIVEVVLLLAKRTGALCGWQCAGGREKMAGVRICSEGGHRIGSSNGSIIVRSVGEYLEAKKCPVAEKLAAGHFKKKEEDDQTERVGLRSVLM